MHMAAEVLDSAKFEDFEEFMGQVQQLWDSQWERVHAAPREGAQRRRFT
jgi:hypothetical protein